MNLSPEKEWIVDLPNSLKISMFVNFNSDQTMISLLWWSFQAARLSILIGGGGGGRERREGGRGEGGGEEGGGGGGREGDGREGDRLVASTYIFPHIPESNWEVFCGVIDCLNVEQESFHRVREVHVQL